MNRQSIAFGRTRVLAAEIMIVSAVICALAGAADAAEKLWGSENLLSGPKLSAGDTVTVSLTRKTTTTPKRTDKTDGSCKTCVLPELSARIVKVLPNGNLVLEARARLGEGSMLIGGETARIDVSVDRRVHVGRLSNLAVVARRIDTEKLAGILRGMNGPRVAVDRGKTAKRKQKP